MSTQYNNRIFPAFFCAIFVNNVTNVVYVLCQYIKRIVAGKIMSKVKLTILKYR